MEPGMISVDKWSDGSQAYFLTHLHADHTAGLSPTWKRGPLFCSHTTAKLFPFKFPGFSLSLLRVLRIGKWVPFSLISPSSHCEVRVQVMAIDANHCPGSVMYLFCGDFGFMLYTGDFRWESSSERTQIGKSMLLNALGKNKVDIVYLDNTYCNPSFSFPSRKLAAQQVVDVISAHPNHDVIIGINSLGKEDLLLHIARVLKMKIWVWPERLRTMHLLGFDDVFTTKTSLTRIRAVPRYSFSVETLEGLNEMRPTIGIMPSGLPWAVQLFQGNKVFGLNEKNGNIRTVEKPHKHIFSVSYSDHSSFTEIKEFVKLIRPTKLKGIVSYLPCISPQDYFGHLYKENRISTSLYPSIMKKGSGKVEASVELETKRKRTNYDEDKCVGRVSILRRTGQGAKIVQID